MRYLRLLVSAITALLFTVGMLMPVGCGAGSDAGDEGRATREAQDVNGSRDSSGEGWQAAGYAFDSSRAMQYIKQLSVGIGLRPAGSEGEAEAAAYIAGVFADSDYEDIVEQAFPAVDDNISRNIYVEDIGTKPEWVVIVGAHYDSAGGTGSPGANDNASGVGVILELARVFQDIDNVPTLLFVAFASEEIPEGYDEDEVGYGSDYMAEHLQEIEGEVIGMVNADMVGVGDALDANATMEAPAILTWLFATLTGIIGVDITVVKDPGWSDNAVFEERGIPSLYIEWVTDLNYHSPGDSYDRIDEGLVEQSGCLLEGFLETMNADLCRMLEQVQD